MRVPSMEVCDAMKQACMNREAYRSDRHSERPLTMSASLICVQLGTTTSVGKPSVKRRHASGESVRRFATCRAICVCTHLRRSLEPFSQAARQPWPQAHTGTKAHQVHLRQAHEGVHKADVISNDDAAEF